MADLFQFTEEDMGVLKELVLAYRNRRLPLRSRQEDEYHQAPEVYVVRTPTGGIGGNSEGLLTGTGALALLDDSFSSASCQVYRIDDSGLPHPSGPLIKVYNIGKAAVPNDRWAVVERDKWGRWIVQSGSILADTDEQTTVFTVVTDCSFDIATCIFTKTTKTVTITGRNITVTVV